MLDLLEAANDEVCEVGTELVKMGPPTDPATQETYYDLLYELQETQQGMYDTSNDYDNLDSDGDGRDWDTY